MLGKHANISQLLSFSFQMGNFIFHYFSNGWFQWYKTNVNVFYRFRIKSILQQIKFQIPRVMWRVLCWPDVWSYLIVGIHIWRKTPRRETSRGVWRGLHMEEGVGGDSMIRRCRISGIWYGGERNRRYGAKMVIEVGHDAAYCLCSYLKRARVSL